MHTSRRTASDGDAVRQPISHMARNSADSHRQDPCGGQSAEVEGAFDSRWGEKAGSDRTLSTWIDRRAEPRPFRTIHGDQRSRFRFIPDLTLLLGFGSDG